VSVDIFAYGVTNSCMLGGGSFEFSYFSATFFFFFSNVMADVSFIFHTLLGRFELAAFLSHPTEIYSCREYAN